MHYVGGKYRCAKAIMEQILRYAGDRTTYIEPFLGGAAIASRVAPYFPIVRLSDIHPDLVLMWRAAINGWIPPSDITLDEYKELRNAEPSALRGFAGFGASFGGKWFGGYGRHSIVGGKPAKEFTITPGSARTVIRQADTMRHADITLTDYRDIRFSRNAVIYADPPYAGNVQGFTTGSFDTAEFWKYAEAWVISGAIVLVSERTAPDEWCEVWRKPVPDFLSGNNVPDARLERLFVHETQLIRSGEDS